MVDKVTAPIGVEQLSRKELIQIIQKEKLRRRELCRKKLESRPISKFSKASKQQYRDVN